MRRVLLVAVLFVAACEDPPPVPGSLTELAGREPKPTLLAALAVPAAPTTLAAWQVYAEGLRTRLRTDAGLVYPRTPPAALLVGERHIEGVRLIDLVLDGYEGMSVPAVLYLPENASMLAPVPGVLFSVGHEGAAGKASAAYQVMAWSLAKSGVAVMNFDWLGMGTRFSADQRHVPMGLRSIMVGLSPATPCLDEPLRAFDYLASRPEVDPSRIGIAGQSGGGMVALHLAAADERIAAAVSVDYLTPSSRIVPDGWGDPDSVLPHWLGYSSNDELAALIAPRPFLAISGDDDVVAPTTAMDTALTEARAVYHLFDADDLVRHYGALGEKHCYCDDKVDATLAFLGEHLLGGPVVKQAVPAGGEPLAMPVAGQPRWPDLVAKRWKHSPAPPASGDEASAALAPVRAGLPGMLAYQRRPMAEVPRVAYFDAVYADVAVVWISDTPELTVVHSLAKDVGVFIALSQPMLDPEIGENDRRYLIQNGIWVGRPLLGLAVEDLIWASDAARQAGAAHVIAVCDGPSSALACAAAAGVDGAPDAYVLDGLHADLEATFAFGQPDPSLYFATPGLGGLASSEMLAALATPRPLAIVHTDASGWSFLPAAYAAQDHAAELKLDAASVLEATSWAIERVAR